MLEKYCSRCNTIKLTSEFNRKSSSKDGYQPYCRDCSNAHSRKYYSKNSGRIIQQVRKSRAKRRTSYRQAMWNYLLQHPCVDCGETDPLVLEFDHEADKLSEVGTLVRNGYAWKTILEEIDKCVVRCANCHRRKTANDFGWYADVDKSGDTELPKPKPRQRRL